MRTAKVKTKPGKRSSGTDAATVEMREFLVRFYLQEPGLTLLPRRWWVAAIYLAAGKTSTFGGRIERLTVAMAVFRLDTRLRTEHGIKLRVTDSALVRLHELTYPEDGSVASPAATVQREIEEPSERLIRSGKVKSGDTMGVDKHPVGNRLQVSVVRGN